MADVLEFPPPATDASDVQAREQALDITRSWIVEAPAGSGKTGLLIQRFLKLLAGESVNDPAEVLAITFTRKATAEMTSRVLAQLASAASGIEPTQPFDIAARPLAAAVLARDRLLGWDLLDHPHRLNIRTIDSAGMNIASALPILSGSGGALTPQDDSSELCAGAARRTLMLLGGEDRQLDSSLELLLLHRDGNLANCEHLLSFMLQCRDQWGELVPLTRPHLDDQFLDSVVLARLDKALDLAICRILTRLSRTIPQDFLSALCELAAEMGYAEGYNGSPSPLALCAGRSMPPEERSAHLEHWRALVDLLLIKDGSFRSPRGINRKTVAFRIEPQHKRQLIQLIDRVRDDDSLREHLCAVRNLPPGRYPRDQWPVAKALFRVLSRALLELQLLFSERGECDFAEIGLLARTALHTGTAAEDLSVASGFRLQHLLVDEMQDTSASQCDFIQLLTEHWDGAGQTVFLVGDPKQSIYLFRQARVERFVQTMHTARIGGLPLGVLRLSANFRSQPGLVQSFNDDFALLFPSASIQTDEIPFRRASATRTGNGRRVWHADPIPNLPDRAECRTAQIAQVAIHAAQIRELILEWRARPLPVDRTEPWKIAVLVRNRSHLAGILPALKGPAPIPFRAVEIEPLGEQAEILDLLALTRALLHPADRIAWLSLLRTPWCGLSLADIYRLAGGDDKTLATRTLIDLMSVRRALLSPDGAARLAPFAAVMTESLSNSRRMPLAALVHRTWQALGTPAYATPEALNNAERFFALLDELAEPGGSISLRRLGTRVARLYAAPCVAPDAVDLMTLHKAKGLEWDFVIVPALHRISRSTSDRLLSWLETDAGNDVLDDSVAHGMIAPIASYGGAAGDLNQWMRGIQSAREAAERRRLFYVACTRAREEVHLFASPNTRSDGSISPPATSLLAAAWPAAQRFFTPAAAPSVLPMPSRPTPRILETLAASALPETSNSRRIIRRIPNLAPPPPPSSLFPLPSSFLRPEGSFSARAFGNALHAFLELAANRIADGVAPSRLLTEIPGWSPRIEAVLRSSGIGPRDVARLAADVLRGIAKTLSDSEGQWLLAPHLDATSEAAFTSLDGDAHRSSIRLDRTFLAGPTPLSTGSEFRWIVDYKTTSLGPQDLDSFLAAEREKYAPQLEAYASLLSRRGPPLRLALYYPMLPRLIWWRPQAVAAANGSQALNEG